MCSLSEVRCGPELTGIGQFKTGNAETADIVLRSTESGRRVARSLNLRIDFKCTDAMNERVCKIKSAIGFAKKGIVNVRQLGLINGASCNGK